MNFKKLATKKLSLAIAFALASSCLSISTFSQKAHAYGAVDVCQDWITGELYRCGDIFYGV